jgi:hypothetical protein
MLARLTRENAALIKQRDRLEAAAAEAGRSAAALAAAAAERQGLLREQAAARAELEASRGDCAKAAAAVKQLTAERDRLLQQVGMGIKEGGGCRVNCNSSTLRAFIACCAVSRVSVLDAKVLSIIFNANPVGPAQRCPR